MKDFLKRFKSYLNTHKRACYNCKHEEHSNYRGNCHGCHSTRGLMNFKRKVEV